MVENRLHRFYMCLLYGVWCKDSLDNDDASVFLNDGSAITGDLQIYFKTNPYTGGCVEWLQFINKTCCVECLPISNMIRANRLRQNHITIMIQSVLVHDILSNSSAVINLFSIGMRCTIECTQVYSFIFSKDLRNNPHNDQF